MPIVRVTLDFAMVGQIFQNVLHFENTDGLLTLSQIADDIQANWITPLRTVTDDNGSWVKITVKDMANPTFSPFIKPIAVPGSADHLERRGSARRDSKQLRSHRGWILEPTP